MNKVLIFDLGSQYTQLIARKVREFGVYSEIIPYTTSVTHIKKEKPAAIILSGGPRSVYDKDALLLSKEIFQMDVPVLGICYGLQLMAHLLGGRVSPSQKREYGFASLEVKDSSTLLAGLSRKGQVWMSHGDKVEEIPPGFVISGETANCKTAVIENRKKKCFGVQFHPEVIHSKEGLTVISNFLFKVAAVKADWSMGSFVESKIKEIRGLVGDKKVICGLSGGVDSLVASMIIHNAIKNKQVCVFVDNGLLRKGQYQQLMEKFRRKFALNVVGVNASGRFLQKLNKVTSPEQKRKIIGREFIHIFENEAEKLGGAEFLAQGTIYPDVIESNPVKGPSSSIKSHHNVGGLPEGLKFRLVEPLRELFKDEVRALGLELGVDKDFILQHPFPGPGLAVRIVGAVTRERLRIIRDADDIIIQEIKAAGIYHDLWQAFAVLLPVRSVGVMGDKRTYQRVVVIRLVQSIDGMTANWFSADSRVLSCISSRIVNEVDGVNRVVYDVTSKPPGTIEWE